MTYSLLQCEMKGRKPKYTRIEIYKKIDIIRRLESGEPVQKLANEYSVARSTISLYKKHKEDIIKYAELLKEQEGSTGKKIMTNIENSDLEKALFAWFQKTRSSGSAMSGPILCAKALSLNQELNGPPNFKASNGWLHG